MESISRERERLEETIRVGSFSGRGHYVVSVAERYCTCPHHRHTGAFCRHLVLAEMILEIRRRAERHADFLPSERERAEERARDLVARVFERGRGYRKTYATLGEVLAFRFASPRLVAAARAAHARAIEAERGTS